MTNNSEKYYNYDYTSLDDCVIKHIKTYYKVIDVDWLDDTILVNKVFDDDYFIIIIIKKKK